MRYRIDQSTGQTVPIEGDGMFTGTAIYGLIIGIGFIIVGLKARQRWISFWGAGLSLASIASLFTIFQ